MLYRSELGYSALWIPEAVTRDAIVASTLALEASTRIIVATGIVPLYARDAMTANAAWRTIEEAFPGRFILGIGVSHKPAVEMMRKTTYAPPLATMDAGRVLAQGTPAEIRERARSDQRREPNMEDAFIAVVEAARAEEAVRHAASRGVA